jgi:hypothetical protein
LHKGEPDHYVICVYTYDYRDKEDRDRIRNRLKELGWTDPIPYKSDKMTLDNIAGSMFFY